MTMQIESKSAHFNYQKETKTAIKKAFKEFNSKAASKACGESGKTHAPKLHLSIDSYAKLHHKDSSDASLLDLNSDGKISIWERGAEIISQKILKRGDRQILSPMVTGVIYERTGLKDQEERFCGASNRPKIGDAISFEA